MSAIFSRSTRTLTRSEGVMRQWDFFPGNPIGRRHRFRHGLRGFQAQIQRLSLTNSGNFRMEISDIGYGSRAGISIPTVLRLLLALGQSGAVSPFV